MQEPLFVLVEYNVPHNPASPQAWNRFSYVVNRPINFNDPTGHCYGPVLVICGEVAVLAVAAILTIAAYESSSQFQESVDSVGQMARSRIERALRRGSEKHEEDIREMEANAVLTADNGRGPGKGGGGRCDSSAAKELYCLMLIPTFVITTIAVLVGRGSHNQDESNSHDTLKLQTFTPQSTLTPTSTTTPSLTPTATSTPTLTSTSTPASTPTIAPSQGINSQPQKWRGYLDY